jgi:hypothetical protein
VRVRAGLVEGYGDRWVDVMLERWLVLLLGLCCVVILLMYIPLPDTVVILFGVMLSCIFILLSLIKALR